MSRDLRDWLPKAHKAYFIGPSLANWIRHRFVSMGQRVANAALRSENDRWVCYFMHTVKASPSSRKIERATYDLWRFGLESHPDHDTIAALRSSRLCQGTQVRLCQNGGLVISLGHVALDGTKVKANASKHKAMSYGRMKKKASELEAEVKRLLAQAEATDAAEDALYPKANAATTSPKTGSSGKGAWRRSAPRRIGSEAEAEYAIAVYEDKLKIFASSASAPAGSQNPLPKNLMRKNSATSPTRTLWCRAAPSCKPTTAREGANLGRRHPGRQRPQTVSMVKRMKTNTGGNPKRLTADSGYYNQDQIQQLPKDIDAYIATQKHKHTDPIPKPPRGRIPKNATPKRKNGQKATYH